jgi:hypothetical protein
VREALLIPGNIPNGMRLTRYALLLYFDRFYLRYSVAQIKESSLPGKHLIIPKAPKSGLPEKSV